MANTKGMEQNERKSLKRKARKKLKGLYHELNRKQKVMFNDPESNVGIKQFVTDLKAKTD